MIRFIGFAVSILAILIFGHACSGPGDQTKTSADGANAPSRINVYSARHYDADKRLYDAFEAETGIEVRVREAGAAQLLEIMKAEGDASPADIVLAADVGTLWRFKQAGLTQPLKSAHIEQVVPERLRGPAGHWIGLAKRYRVIAYDPQRHSPEDVATMTALTDERFDGEICVRSSSNIYNLSLLAEFIARDGADSAGHWAEAVRNNFARDPQGGDTSQIKAVAAGACSAAIVNHYYWVRLAESGARSDRQAAAATRLSFASAGDGVHTNITGASLAANAPHPEAARRFIEFLARPRGQAMLITETKEFPILEGVALPEGLEALPDIAESGISLDKLGEHQSQAQRIYDRVGWN